MILNSLFLFQKVDCQRRRGCRSSYHEKAQLNHYEEANNRINYHSAIKCLV